MTLFPVFDVPVFWPILLLYWLVLFTVTMKRQIKHMIKHKYVPWSTGKKVSPLPPRPLPGLLGVWLPPFILCRVPPANGTGSNFSSSGIQAEVCKRSPGFQRSPEGSTEGLMYQHPGDFLSFPSRFHRSCLPPP